VVVLGLEIAGCDDAELLVRFIEVSFGDSVDKSVLQLGDRWWVVIALVRTYFSFWRAIVFAILADIVSERYAE
jgi:hypothetical protein